ncbi:uncharacterized protein BX664DRAFT_202234 [Halteromyces radiatus]|uniref:uncharacterized protein n=1 Tax=Halteromyces radiatus TaxID=101107 RepID=UPI00221F624E|nr:uncharacterized protein BX664DRAFT_202234 [Halteromyces radiatus]KAI8079778.1 hypothetical protein BX664DRAFT_202234 [Halteromyces radiatus]
MKSLNHVRNLYERAVAIYCTDVGLWEDYICFMMESAHVLVFLKPIALRAVRNCPWSGALWAHLARFMESSGSPMEEVIGIFDRAISNKALLASLEDLVTLMMAKCAHARRQVDWEQVDEDSVSYLRLTFQEALMYIDESFPETGDPYYRIEKYWAMIEGKRLGDIERAREIWDGVIKKHGRNAEAWLNYIELERSLGNIHRCTSLFKQAVAKNLDYPDRLLNIWLSMEYEEGSVESLEDCFVRINKKSKVLTREWQAALAQQEAMEEEKKQKEINQKIKKSAHRRKQKDSKKEATMTTQGKKRRLSSTDDEKDTMDHSMKKAKAQDQQSSTTKDENDGFKKPAFTPRNRGGRGRGRRGGRVALGGSGVQQRQQDTTQTSSTEPRSNEDFRAMLLAGRK